MPLPYRTGMATYEFLSPEWIEAAREIRDHHLNDARVPSLELKMNLAIDKAPFDPPELEAYLDSTGGELVIDLGHHLDADVTVSLDYASAKAVLIDGNGDAALQGFMTGKIRVEGDVAKLLSFQSTPQSPLQKTITEELRAITS